MATQPPVAEAQQLLHLVVANPVVLVVVEDGQEYVEVGEQVSQPGLRRQADGVVRNCVPTREKRSSSGCPEISTS